MSSRFGTIFIIDLIEDLFKNLDAQIGKLKDLEEPFRKKEQRVKSVKLGSLALRSVGVGSLVYAMTQQSSSELRRLFAYVSASGLAITLLATNYDMQTTAAAMRELKTYLEKFNKDYENLEKSLKRLLSLVLENNADTEGPETAWDIIREHKEEIKKILCDIEPLTKVDFMKLLQTGGMTALAQMVTSVLVVCPEHQSMFVKVVQFAIIYFNSVTSSSDDSNESSIKEAVNAKELFKTLELHMSSRVLKDLQEDQHNENQEIHATNIEATTTVSPPQKFCETVKFFVGVGCFCQIISIMTDFSKMNEKPISLEILERTVHEVEKLRLMSYNIFNELKKAQSTSTAHESRQSSAHSEEVTELTSSLLDS